jgi:hypothetical protein
VAGQTAISDFIRTEASFNWAGAYQGARALSVLVARSLINLILLRRTGRRGGRFLLQRQVYGSGTDRPLNVGPARKDWFRVASTDHNPHPKWDDQTFGLRLSAFAGEKGISQQLWLL